MFFFAVIDFSPDYSELRPRMAHIAVLFENLVFVVVFKHRKRVFARCAEHIAELRERQLPVLGKMLLCFLPDVLLDAPLDAKLRCQHHKLAAADKALEHLLAVRKLVALELNVHIVEILDLKAHFVVDLQ